VAVPIVVGTLFLAGLASNAALIAAELILGLHALMFLWALSQRWEDQLENASESRLRNRELGEQYLSMVFREPSQSDWALIETQRLAQDAIDEKAVVSEQEKRYGWRSALKMQDFSCSKCGKVPATLVPDACEACGSFPAKWGK
jgi:mobilome CxxCx(11)CxxC protein